MDSIAALSDELPASVINIVRDTYHSLATIDAEPLRR